MIVGDRPLSCRNHRPAQVSGRPSSSRRIPRGPMDRPNGSPNGRRSDADRTADVEPGRCSRSALPSEGACLTFPSDSSAGSSVDSPVGQVDTGRGWRWHVAVRSSTTETCAPREVGPPPSHHTDNHALSRPVLRHRATIAYQVLEDDELIEDLPWLPSAADDVCYQSRSSRWLLFE